MRQGRFKYIVLILFLVSILLIVFLQFNSGQSIRRLIEGNKSLLKELQVQSKLQKLQTDILFVETGIRWMVTADDTLQGDLDSDINKVQSELNEVRSIMTSDNNTTGLVRELAVLAHAKIIHS